MIGLRRLPTCLLALTALLVAMSAAPVMASAAADDHHDRKPDDPFRLQLLDAVDQQHRVAVRKDVPDRLDIHEGHAVWLL